MNKIPYIIAAFLLTFGLGYLARGCMIRNSISDKKDSLAVNHERSAFIDGQKQRDSLEIVALGDSLKSQHDISIALAKQLITIRSKKPEIKPVIDSSAVAQFLQDFAKQNQ